MRVAASTAISKFNDDPSLLPSNISSATMSTHINFCLDKCYFEFNNEFYAQNTDGPMGIRLTVELAELKPNLNKLLLRLDIMIANIRDDWQYVTLYRHFHPENAWLGDKILFSMTYFHKWELTAGVDQITFCLNRERAR